MIKFLASATTALCIVVGLICVWIFLNAAEPGQESYRVVTPIVLVAAIVLGILSYRVARRR